MRIYGASRDSQPEPNAKNEVFDFNARCRLPVLQLICIHYIHVGNKLLELGLDRKCSLAGSQFIPILLDNNVHSRNLLLRRSILGSLHSLDPDIALGFPKTANLQRPVHREPSQPSHFHETERRSAAKIAIKADEVSPIV